MAKPAALALGTLALLALQGTLGGSALPGLPDQPGCGVGRTSGCELWVAAHDENDEHPQALALSPDGSRVYALGFNPAEDRKNHFSLLSYDARHGTPLWKATYPGYAEGLVVSPDGERVFVTGNSQSASNDRIAVVAFAASNGSQVWVYLHPLDSYPQAIAISPKGETVFIAGAQDVRNDDYATLAINASTGSLQWLNTYDGDGGWVEWYVSQDVAQNVAPSPDGSRVFVTGLSASKAGESYESATLAIDATTGATLWSQRHAKHSLIPGVAHHSEGYGLGVSPDGASVYALASDSLQAYDAATGALRWLNTDVSCPERWPRAFPGECALRVGPEGTRLYLRNPNTIRAHDTRDGSTLWESLTRLDGGRPAEFPTDMTLSADGRRVYVAMTSEKDEAATAWLSDRDIAVEAYDAEYGLLLGRTTYDHDGARDVPNAIRAAPDGRSLFVLGHSTPFGRPGPDEMVTLALDTRMGLSPFLDEHHV